LILIYVALKPNARPAPLVVLPAIPNPPAEYWLGKFLFSKLI
jgi:hypothetical protein